MHEKTSKYYNKGIYIKYIINELQNKLKDNIMNENNNYDYINSKINTIEQNQNK